MPISWQRRIDRATELARQNESARALLEQYARLLAVQRACYDTLRRYGDALTGILERDLGLVRECTSDAFAAARAGLPPRLAAEEPRDEAEVDRLLRDGWHAASPPFHARLVLQPYAEILASLAGSAGSTEMGCEDRRLDTPPGRAACPFCGGPAQVGVLRSEASAEAGGRTLVCGTCATEWAFRRVLCAHCGEQEERRLGYVRAAEFDHVRVDTCETCRHYMKTIDLTRLGLAVPLVDDIATGALDIWARERGYTKVTPNLMGL